jgi:hypothetical protein
LSTEALASTKRLPIDLLKGWGICDRRRDRVTNVEIPYLDPGGNIIGIRYRLSLDSAGPRFKWRTGDRVSLYGQQKLPEIRKRGWVLLVEGESDTWTGWHHKVPTLGIPGKSTWKPEWAEHLEGLDVYLWVEPNADDLIARVGADLPDLKVIYAPEGIKDISEGHLKGMEVATMVETLKADAILAQDVLRLQANERASELRERATSVLALPDPLDAVEQAIATRYGGDTHNPLLVYLAATTRLLFMRPGAMPAHLLILGAPSAGKSYAMRVALGLLPEESKHELDAASPRVLIYDTASLEHKVLVFGEADSLPAGEDNPPASAIRNLCQDHYLHYAVTVRDQETNDFTVRTIEKPGPTVLITTSTKALGSQLMTRFFTLDVAGDADQVRKALAMQARLEVDDVAPVDESLIDFQAYLQALAPWDVVVPFVDQLAEEIGKSAVATRVLRDFQRLLSLVKAVAILRHQHRDRDQGGRLVATVEDYTTVYELVADIYAASVTGLSEGVANLVTKVAELREKNSEQHIGYAVLAKALGIDRGLAARRAKSAIRNRWLANQEPRKNYPADLVIGEPLPEKSGLPDPDTLRDHDLLEVVI